jgi:putative membrane protein
MPTTLTDGRLGHRISVTTVVGQMWDGDDHLGGGWWWVMGIGWLVFLGVLGVLAVVLVRHFTGTAVWRSAEDILAERFARGEIDEEEYRRRLGALR